ncbi:hypothetical protein CDZ97_26870 [Mameliella alba]|uniref:hypothetical protein n=2 Tax=Mameliella alba TaxID=561184 RepID=UPI000B52C991|nr:hypothetical protein [Mameliella alba]OWV51923.1 hypothetical protein CDZ97_26870 [Mameliella alba]
MAERLILHAGYHQAGAGLIRQWLEDHAETLAPQLALYGPDHPQVVPLRAAALATARGRSGGRAALGEAARALAGALASEPAAQVCLSEEDLLGPPLGHAEEGHLETEIYPGLCPILDVLMAELAGFDPVLALFEREPGAWLENLHRQAVNRGGFAGDLDSYLAQFDPRPDWAGLRDEIAFALQGRGRLAAWSFEEEFPRGAVAEMGFFRLLDIPAPLMAQCRPTLRARPVAAPHPDAGPAAPPPVLLMGGANALVPEGWGHVLRRDHARQVAGQALSGAAGTTATALYRLLAQGDDWPGAPVIWEQGINEYTHLTGGQELDSLIHHVEWLLQLCARQGRPFVALLTRTRMQAGMARDDSYVTRLRALFADYGVTVLDDGALIRVLERGPPRDLDAWYARNAVHDTTTPLPRRLAEAALVALETAPVPRPPRDRAAHFDPLDLCLRAPASRPDSFALAGMDCAFAPFGETLPIETPGRALAAILVTSGSGPVIRLSAGKTLLGCYVTQVSHGPGHPPQQLRQLVLGQGGGGVEIPGGVVQIDTDIRHDTPPDKLIIQTMYHQGDPPSDPRPAGLVALLCEEPRKGATR